MVSRGVTRHFVLHDKRTNILPWPRISMSGHGTVFLQSVWRATRIMRQGALPFLQRRITNPTSDQTPVSGSALDPHAHPHQPPTYRARLPLSGLPSGQTPVRGLPQTPLPEQPAAAACFRRTRARSLCGALHFAHRKSRHPDQTACINVQTVAQAFRKYHHPLPHGHCRQLMLHHVRSRLHHTPCAAAQTHPAPLREYPTKKSWPHFSQRARANPCVRMPGCR